MILDIHEFNNEINALKKSKAESVLHPLRREQIKKLLFGKIETMPVGERYASHERKNNFMRYIISSLVGLSLVAGTAFASQGSKPGDFLYPVKTVTEKIQLGLAVSSEAKAIIASKQAQERLDELDELIQLQTHLNNGTSNANTDANADLKGNVGAGNNAGLDEKKNDNQDKINSNQRADSDSKTEAKINLQKALNTLTEIKMKLEAKGNVSAAAAVSDDINRLQQKAQENAVDENAVDIKAEAQVGSDAEAAKQGSSKSSGGSPDSSDHNGTDSNTNFKNDLKLNNTLEIK